MINKQIPRWDLGNVYPSIESKELANAISNFDHNLNELEIIFVNTINSSDAKTPPLELSDLIENVLRKFNSIYSQAGTIRSYIYSYISTNSRDKIAMKKLSEFEQTGLKLQNLSTQFQRWIGKLARVLDEVIVLNEYTKLHAFALKDAAEQSKYMMSDAEENLAAELHLSGAAGWTKLQGTLTSQLSVDFEFDGEVQKLPMPSLINLHSHPDESVRRRAYETEMEAWKTLEEPLAAAMNGIKGSSGTLNKRRGRTDDLHTAIDMARIDRPTLNAMLSAMHDSFPLFQKYFDAKAKRLKKDRLAWWDIFAPVGKSQKIYSWEEAEQVILTNFDNFTPSLSTFAKRAFDNNWIDAEQRVGKRGGAFCMGLPSVKESRVLCNFDGNLDQVSTIAHELGHAFHNECAYKANKTEIQQDTPMTLAETASIMCETIIMEAIYDSTTNPEEKLAILDTMLTNNAQVIVDIYSRYLFEKEVFERRAQSELSADDLNEIMEKAQKATYGTGLDERYLMKYMWTWKPHYYNANLSFYNFPYAFGLLFATGLYAIYKDRGESFISAYTELLASTGETSAAELAARFDIDIRDKNFWAASINIITQKIEPYTQL